MRTHVITATLAAAIVAASVSCSSVVRQGEGSSYLIVESLQGVEGPSGEEGTTLRSDVETLVKRQVDGKEVRVPTVFEDGGLVSFRLGLKDPLTPVSPNNFITITRYRVDFSRTDGRNTPGVDVPFGFDGAITVTVSDSATAGFTLVRLQAKGEPPLIGLRGGAGLYTISTIATVTFYGTDQTGRAVSATGKITVHFADWADPES